MSREKWFPVPGDFINIQLPDELVRATVSECPDEDTVIAVMNVNPPISKTHKYRLNDVLAARRGANDLGQEVWRVVDAG